jgi:hypothetical protein
VTPILTNSRELAEFAPPKEGGAAGRVRSASSRASRKSSAFTEKHGRAPQHGEDRDIFERLYAVRLDRLRALFETFQAPCSSA